MGSRTKLYVRDAVGALPVRLRSHVPFLGLLARYQRSWLRPDLIAGAAVAVSLVPQELAYATLAGMPPMHGLYATIAALVAYALFGMSSHEAASPSAISSLLTFAALGSLAVPESSSYIQLAALLAVLVGGFRLLLGVLNAGMLANLLSRSVLTGFTSGAGVLIAVSQLPDLLGAEAARGGGDVIEAMEGLIAAAAGTVWPALVMGAVGLAVLLVFRRHLGVSMLATVTVATVLTWALRLDRLGVPIVGEVPTGLPGPRVPWADLRTVRSLLPTAFVLALVGYLEGLASSRAIAAQSGERILPNRELFAYGWVSVAAGLFRGFPVGGSFSTTAINHRSGGRSQLSNVFAAGYIAIVVLGGAPALRFLPRPVLAAIVLAAVTNLIDLPSIREALRITRTDATALVATFLGTLLLGVETGFLVGAGTNLVLHLSGDIRPPVPEIGRVEGSTHFRDVGRFPTRTQRDVAILRLDAPLLFLNAGTFDDRVNRLLAERPDLKGLVLDMSSVTDIDATGVHALTGLLTLASEADVEVRLARVLGGVRSRLRRARLWDEVFVPIVYPSLPDALAALSPLAETLRTPQEGEDTTHDIL